jgi:transcriptional regulator with XRE-family HTH domain
MLGELLKNARIAAGLTQEDLAFKAGVDRTYISQLEHDKKSPTLQMLFRLCQATGASATEIVRRIEGSSKKSVSK